MKEGVLNASQIFIAILARNQMTVGMKYGLASSFSTIPANVKTIHQRVLIQNALSLQYYQLMNALQLVLRQLKIS